MAHNLKINNVTYNGVESIDIPNTAGTEINFISPTGSLSINDNGTYNVRDKETAVVNIGTAHTLQVTYEDNTTETLTIYGEAVS